MPGWSGNPARLSKIPSGKCWLPSVWRLPVRLAAAGIFLPVADVGGRLAHLPYEDGCEVGGLSLRKDSGIRNHCRRYRTIMLALCGDPLESG